MKILLATSDCVMMESVIVVMEIHAALTMLAFRHVIQDLEPVAEELLALLRIQFVVLLLMLVVVTVLTQSVARMVAAHQRFLTVLEMDCVVEWTNLGK